MRFSLSFRNTIETAPLQIYCSALVFSPSESLIRKLFRNLIPSWIEKTPETPKNWGAQLLTLGTHSDVVQALFFSPNGNILASASKDGIIKLWDAQSDVLQTTLEKESPELAGKISRMSFSPNGNLLAVMFDCHGVHMWDLTTRMFRRTLNQNDNGNGQRLKDGCFSPDCRVFVALYRRRPPGANGLCIWDVATGKELYASGGDAFSFLSDNTLIAYQFPGNIILHWNLKHGEFNNRTLEDVSNKSSCIATFSSDGKPLVTSYCDGHTVRIWDTSSGALIRLIRTLKYRSELKER
jgi:WD40 repeat protein